MEMKPHQGTALPPPPSLLSPPPERQKSHLLSLMMSSRRVSDGWRGRCAAAAHLLAISCHPAAHHLPTPSSLPLALPDPPPAATLPSLLSAQWSVRRKELLTQAGEGNKLTCG